MRYEGDIYRPPSEAYSLLVQVTVGCTHNKCTFCSMFKNKRFHLRNMDEVMEDLEEARKLYRYVERIFLCDGDALCLSNRKLLVILQKIQELFPECRRVNVYGNAADVLHKTPEELRELYENGVRMIYIGAESGSEKVLKDVCKGVTGAQLIEAVHKIEDSGIQASVTFISGLAGKDGWREHAIESGRMISRMNASYVALLTLMVEPAAPLYEKIQSGEFRLLSPEEVIAETYLMIENMNPEKPCVFRSNHASNYLSLKGTLPEDKEAMLAKLRRAMKDSGMLKDERFRML
ncbi:radical SAM protein [Hornefia butyriciproducens]|uniref:B12-binding domain-containing radical SAM protein n=1 Tax=Hornefia butyriciproducens TaxID=2652293 RepID=A0A6L5Y5W8_9FIRM|nr:radical SAM protein [Hornefia butyriciproducens]MCI7412289.1 B12-binding domain-containing radical SAM protein [Clostridiales bacterium]MDY6211331.1 radical SAM protein [Hornefia butyriciproducens]MST51472.1 B12-binding domain-containing radical SAM protein [Hornefia butyriciproducens]